MHPSHADPRTLDDLAVLTERLDVVRSRIGGANTEDEKAQLGQFLTPGPVAGLMASMLVMPQDDIRLLDPGAGAGALFAAAVRAACDRATPPRTITVTAYELDDRVLPELQATMSACEQACRRVGITFVGEVVEGDFLAAAEKEMLTLPFGRPPRRFNTAILNPPYRKINVGSAERQTLRRMGVETSNLYSGFLAATLLLLDDDAEVVAITPRSFCNGPYFRPFRQLLLERTALRRIHSFTRRDKAFHDEKVLQENIIFHAVRGGDGEAAVRITTSSGASTTPETDRTVPAAEVVRPDDPEAFIHIPTADAAAVIEGQPSTLASLGLTVSTGRVVDFRALDVLRADPCAGAVPLLYPTHLQGGSVTWPKAGKKPNAILVNESSRSLLVPNETFVLVKRFTAKEERRRVVASVHVGGSLPGDALGIENHVNYFHQRGRGLDLHLARGLAAYLNSTGLDDYFRQFNGHTQVNATDLRNIRYPADTSLRRIGKRMEGSPHEQGQIDAIVAEETTDGKLVGH